MEFQWNRKACKLQGVCTPLIQSIPIQAITKYASQASSLFVVCPQHATTSLSTPIHSDMQELIENFSDIYQEPIPQPPPKTVDHQITLKGQYGTNQCTFLQVCLFSKAKIKKKVQNMLKMGLIRLSTSLFSSPILLVKERMNIDFPFLLL